MMRDETIAAAKVGTASAGIVAYGITLEQWIGIATLIFIVLQIGLLIPKYIVLFRKCRARRRRKNVDKH